eukprot:1392816-Rhodomonas_salina.2
MQQVPSKPPNQRYSRLVRAYPRFSTSIPAPRTRIQAPQYRHPHSTCRRIKQTDLPLRSSLGQRQRLERPYARSVLDLP